MDQICWKPLSKQIFDVCSYYRVLDSTTQISFSWDTLWKPKVPTKVSLFLWIAALRRISTTDNLRRHRVIVVDWYCMCKRDGETIDRVLMHCPIARVVDHGVFHCLGSVGYA